MANFKDRLTNILDSRDMSQKELAQKTNITPATISRYINGNHNPSAENAKRIASELGISVDWLMGISDSIHPQTQSLTSKDKSDIAKDLNNIKQQLIESDELMFDGIPMDDESITKILSALEIGMEMVRKKNKKRQ